MKIRLSPLSPHVREIIIYTAMTFGGLFIDMGLSNLLVYVLHFPLLMAGACGLLAGAITNYFIHLKITFKHRNLSVSWHGLFKYLQTCAVGAAVRLILLTLLGWFSSFPSVISLTIATGLSFVVNYILSRFYVFQHKNQ